MTIETEDNNAPQHRELSVQERRALHVSLAGCVTLGACWVGLLVAMILTSQVPITQRWADTNIATLATELWSATNIAFIVGLCVVPLLRASANRRWPAETFRASYRNRDPLTCGFVGACHVREQNS